MAVHDRRYRLTRAPAWLTAAFRDGPAMPAQLVAAATFVAMAATEGGYDATTWYPVALLTLGLVAVTAIVVGRPRRPPALVLAALALFAAHTLWTYASIGWAGVEGDALGAANRNAYYLLVLALFVLWPPGASGARLVLALFSLGVAGVGLVEILRADTSAFPGAYFIGVRLTEPVGYINANVAVWTLGMLGCIGLAAAARAHPAVRGVSLGSATLLAGLALLGQSRGWALALPVGLVVLLALSPDRGRVALAAGLVALVTFAIHGPLLDVHDEYTPARFDGLLADATASLTLAAVVVGLGGAAWGVLELRRAGRSRDRRLPRWAAPAVAAAVLVLGGATLVALADPVSRVERAWNEFKEGGGPATSGSRFASGGSNRWDFWGVAWDAFREEPLKGLGADNFQRYYLRMGDSTEKPRYAHSLELESLAMLGIVGLATLAASLLALLAAALSSLRRGGHAALGAALVATFAYWLAHASVDWFWAFPALTAPALAALGMATGLGRAPEPAAGRPTRRRRSTAVFAGLACAALALLFAGPWLSARQVEHAAEIWPRDPEGAFSALDGAATLNPLSDTPDAVGATIALRLGREADAERRFRELIDEDPQSAYAALEIGLIASADGRREEAVRYLRRSLALNPNDALVGRLLERARAGHRIDPAAVNEKILRNARKTTHSTR